MHNLINIPLLIHFVYKIFISYLMFICDKTDSYDTRRYNKTNKLLIYTKVYFIVKIFVELKKRLKKIMFYYHFYIRKNLASSAGAVE